MPDDEPPTTVAQAEHPRPVRRRKHGEQLRAAIHGAVLDELRERGFTALTMDAVAARAQTGKATLYRYWPGKIELVVDAVLSSLPRVDVPEDDGNLRGQLLAVLRQTADDMAGPTGVVIRGLIAELMRSPELKRALGPPPADPAVAPILEVLRRAALRGEVPASVLHPRVAGVGPGLLRSYAVLNELPIPEAVLVEIVDLVLLPLLHGYTTRAS